MSLNTAKSFLTRRRGHKGRANWTDILTYAYLIAGVLIMFSPVIWTVASSFKTKAALTEFPPTFLPLAQISIDVDGYDEPFPFTKWLWQMVL